jgi:hypothetical protein
MPERTKMSLQQRIGFGLFIALHLAATPALCFYAVHPETSGLAQTALCGTLLAQIVLLGIWLGLTRQSWLHRAAGVGFCSAALWLSLNAVLRWVGMSSPNDHFRIFWFAAVEIVGGVVLCWGFLATVCRSFHWQIVFEDAEFQATPAHRFHLRQLMIVIGMSCLMLALARAVMPAEMSVPPRAEWSGIAMEHAVLAGFELCSLVAMIPALTVVRRAIEIDSGTAIVAAVAVQPLYAGCVAFAEWIIASLIGMDGGEYAGLVLFSLYGTSACYLFVLTASIGVLQLFGWRFERREPT